MYGVPGALRLCELNALPTATALVGFKRQCLMILLKTPTALTAELSDHKFELKKKIKVLEQ